MLGRALLLLAVTIYPVLLFLPPFLTTLEGLKLTVNPKELWAFTKQTLKNFQVVIFPIDFFQTNARAFAMD